MSWNNLSGVGKAELRAARAELHWLSQAAALYALAVLPKEEDWSHYALRWDGTLQRMATADGAVAINLTRGTIELESEELDPRGMTLSEVLDWLSAAVGIQGLDQADLPHEMPAHPLGEGGAFALSDGRAMSELYGWYGAAAEILENHGEVHIWTHHFDIATVTYRGEVGRQVLAGLSPGDAEYDEPYFYVTPWPHPEEGDLLGLPSGHWHTKGWIGAVLTRSELDTHRDKKAAAALFVADAIRVSTELVSTKGSVS